MSASSKAVTWGAASVREFGSERRSSASAEKPQHEASSSPQRAEWASSSVARGSPAPTPLTSSPADFFTTRRTQPTALSASLLFSPPGFSIGRGARDGSGGGEGGGGGGPASPHQSPASTVPLGFSGRRQMLKLTPLHGWHIREDGCLWQGTGEHSSPIVAWAGEEVEERDAGGAVRPLGPNEVLTSNGTVYRLMTLDARVRRVVDKLLPGVFADANPLKHGTEDALFLAARLVHGEAQSAATQRLFASLAELEAEFATAAKGNRLMTAYAAAQVKAAREALANIGLVPG
jgi:hypothetical protein